MFSLIITIVSIALVVALVAATMYHGGDTLTQGRAKADAAAFVSGAQQVSGAAVMYQSLEGAEPSNIEALVTGKYLSSIPTVKNGTGSALNIVEIGGQRVVQAGVAAQDVCEAVNKSAGLSDAQAATTAAANTVPAGAFGCYSPGAAGEYSFVFKF